MSNRFDFLNDLSRRTVERTITDDDKELSSIEGTAASRRFEVLTNIINLEGGRRGFSDPIGDELNTLGRRKRKRAKGRKRRAIARGLKRGVQKAKLHRHKHKNETPEERKRRTELRAAQLKARAELMAKRKAEKDRRLALLRMKIQASPALKVEAQKAFMQASLMNAVPGAQVQQSMQTLPALIE